MKISFVLCVISLCVSVVFNQDNNETSIDIHSSVKHKSDQDLESSSYKSHFKYRNYHKKFVTSTATALADVINEFFIKQDIPFDILLFGNIQKKTVDVVGEMGKKLLGNYTTTVKWTNWQDFQNNQTKINQSAIILTDEDGIEKLNNFVELTNIFPKKLKFLIYTYKSGHLFDAPKFLKYDGHISQFEYFIVDKNDEELELTTFEWFTDTECNFKSYKVLNNFNKTSLKWEKNLENHEKFKNLHNCMIHVFAEFGQSYRRIKKIQAMEYDLMNIVAQKRNFTVVRGQNSQLIETKIRRKEKLVFLDFNVKLDVEYITEYKNYHFTTTFAQDSIRFMISPGELYTSYEKILLPFDELTWYFLITTFGIAFGVIFVVNLLPKHVQDYFYGEGIKIPAFNVIGTFFGIGQLRLPTANFPRIILMIFILFCLIIRTAYQGVMFEMMTKEMRKGSPQTVDDLFEWSFSVHIATRGKNIPAPSKTVYENLDETRQIKIKEFDFFASYLTMCPIIFNPEERFALNVDTIIFYEVTYLCKKSPMLLREVFATIQKGIGMNKNNFLFEAVEEVMQLTIPFGIPQYWFKYHWWYLYERNHYGEMEKVGAQMLRLKDLSFGFIIWLVACGVAVCGLLCELVVFAISKLKKLTRVVLIQVNNTNMLLPKKPIKIKARKSKKLREPAQQKSTLDVQILMEIQYEIINESKIKLNPLEVNLNKDENIQQSQMNAKQAAIKIKDVMDEKPQSKISSKFKESRISIENEKIRSQKCLKASTSKDQKDQNDERVIDVEKNIAEKVDSVNSSKLSSDLQTTKITNDDSNSKNLIAVKDSGKDLSSKSID